MIRGTAGSRKARSRLVICRSSRCRDVSARSAGVFAARVLLRGSTRSHQPPRTLPRQERLVRSQKHHADRRTHGLHATIHPKQVTLDCSGSDEAPRVDKLVERILHCSCQSCSKESGQEGALLQLYPSEGALETPALSDATHTHAHLDIHAPEAG
ncbi:hypothetical protein ABG768_001467 [Culter alburnus]|uniref:Uncharacterized protein n=1 Tax=Culter alburnus TaxID=194366 RepID=A0AAW2A1T2_CULAL